ncbi:MAG TPA: SUMF1/EgtB/PvdO family nonheme iron enzyme, partial [Kofleriaceae bacterium]|nr:SUMF1/EgtB/PvdO family nonheme iron enzyme [Kofleriaceae bacterium]
VLPAIARGALGDRRAWRARTILIGRHAAGALRDALALTAAGAELSHSEVARATGASNDAGLVIFLDQFEELVTLNDPGEAAEAAAIIASLSRGVPGVKVLIAVRGDFLTRVAALPELGTLMTRSLHLLRPLSPADARDAVVGPARAKGVAFETDALIDALVSSIAGQPGALPLLSFALAELWQRRDAARGVIPAAALDAIGGVAGGLARHADAVIGELGRAERICARRIALLLVTHDDTRAERDRRELCPDGDPAAAAALEAMIRGRLVVGRVALVALHRARGEPVYELAHDSLITAWSTLRGWRDEAAGQRGLRTRLAAAADDWRRLGRRRDALWNRAQLAEAARLDELSGAERDFLAASRRAVRRRRLGAIALAASLPAVAVATWVVLQGQGRTVRDRAVAVRLAAAAAHLGDATSARAAAMADRASALQLFDGYRELEAEPVWTRARNELAAARAAYAAAGRELEATLLIDSARDDVRLRMASAIYDQAELAELASDPDAARELAARLTAFDATGALRAAWTRPASLAIDAEGAVRVEVRPFVDRDGRLEPGPPVLAAPAGRLTGSLPPGSYAIELVGGDGLVVRDPILAGRGETLEIALRLPRRADVPAGMVYIPPGRFLLGGSAREEPHRHDFLNAAPIHPVTTAAYLIGITEVTFADWMAFLRALPDAERERRRPNASALNGSTLRLDGGRRPGEPFTLMIKPTTQAFLAREGEPLVYPDRTRRRQIRWEAAPVSGISLDDARAYAAWLAATGKVPGARLCSEREWERAARGADGRTWAHGERVAPDDANIDITYDRRELAYGPDEVGAHPASTSPFGLADTVGNVWEWVEPPPGTALLRGGCWYHGVASAAAANRDFTPPQTRASWAGLRICATPR